MTDDAWAYLSYGIHHATFLLSLSLLPPVSSVLSVLKI
jgi:hypothetical protein